jgi:hypothetical protein
MFLKPRPAFVENLCAHPKFDVRATATHDLLDPIPSCCGGIQIFVLLCNNCGNMDRRCGLHIISPLLAEVAG